MMKMVLNCLLLASLPTAASAQPASEPATGETSLSARIFDEKRTPEQLEVQILLDRGGFSPGVIDGYGGGNTEKAVRAFQAATGLPVTGTVDAALMEALKDKAGGSYLKTYMIRASDVRGPFADVPEDMVQQAKLPRLAYENTAELIAERFHMDVDFLRALNPNANFARAGERLIVVRAGPAQLDEKVRRIVIHREAGLLEAFDEAGALLATYPATVGSSELPTPSGTTEVVTAAPDAVYYFDPEINPWGPDEALEIAAGPNNPVGGIWIDLAEGGYGIHGSPDPHLIGKTASHGCVRLTNWDARELAAAVEQGTVVEFVG